MLNRYLPNSISRLLGALRSRNSAAYLGILIKAMRPICCNVDRVIFQFLCTNNCKTKNDIPPCLLIVSPPRSGSTIISQILIRKIPCVYISNLHLLFPSYASSYLQKKSLFGTNLNKYNNYYGYTSSMRDVNEANEIIDKLFSNKENIELIRKKFIDFIIVMKATSEKPLIFKNVRSYNKLLDIHQTIPEISFLRIKRNTEHVVQSIVRAYHELGTFHPIPENLKKHDIVDPVEFAVQQILEIEKTIDDQKNKISKSNWFELQYEDFCSSPLPIIEKIAKKTLNIEHSQLRELKIPQLKFPIRNKITSSEARRISMVLDKFK